jgi:hypothetical protein
VLLCCGCFAEADAEWNELVDGTVSLPIPTYIFKDGGADGETAAVTPTSIAHNLFILRRAGTFVLEGLTIAYIGTRANASGEIRACVDFTALYQGYFVSRYSAIEETDVLSVLLVRHSPLPALAK